MSAPPAPNPTAHSVTHLPPFPGNPDRDHISLPAPPANPFIGRETEIAAGQELLLHGPRRLITLTGTGGVGKTRLALHLAAISADHHFARVAFVPLASVSDALLVPRAIGTALGLPAEGEIPWLARIVAALRGQPALLVLDNLEHLLPVAPRIADLLAACPDLRILATSRMRLRISEEQEIPVAPLPVSREMRDVRRVQEDSTHDSRLTSHVSDAVALFLERVRAIRPAYSPGEADIRTISAICRRLDGLPLAIELAAARMSHLTADSLLHALERMLPVLTTGQRDAQPRHRTMRDAIAWSVDLLPGPAREWFIRLGGFSASWPLDGAVRVAHPTDLGDSGDPEIMAIEALDAIGTLVDANLLTLAAYPEPNEPLWQMYDTVREYARELLHASGLMTETSERLTTWLVETNAAAGQQLRGPDQALWMARLEIIQPDVRAILQRLVAAETPQAAETALRLCTGAMWFFWNLHARQEDQAWLGKALEIAERTPDRIDPAVYGRGLTADGMLLYVGGAYERAIARLTAAADVLDRAGDRSALATAYGNLGNAHADLGDYPDALDYLERSIAIRRETGEPRALVTPLVNLVATAVSSGDLAAARRRIADATPVVELHGDPINRGYLLCFAAEAALYEGKLAEARDLLRSGHEIVTAVGEVRGIALADMHMAMVEHLSGNQALAASWLLGPLTMAAEQNDLPTTQQSLTVLAHILTASGQWEDAARVLAAAEALRDHLRAAPRTVEQPAFDEMMTTLRSSLPPDDFEAAWHSGGNRPVSVALAAATNLATSLAAVPGRPTLLEPVPSSQQNVGSENLSEREIEVLALVARGHSDREIGDLLSISSRTVSNHVRNILAKLDVSTRTAAAAAAIRDGLVLLSQ